MSKFVPDELTKKMHAKNRGGRDYARERVRQRDKRTCQMCGKKWVEGMRRFDIHHIDGCGMRSQEYDKLDQMDNMITYCHKCHMSLESVTRKISLRQGQFKNSRHAHHHPFYRKSE